MGSYDPLSLLYLRRSYIKGCNVEHNWFQDVHGSAPVAGRWGKLICSNNAIQVKWECPRCHGFSTNSLRHWRATYEFGLDIERLPVLKDNREADE